MVEPVEVNDVQGLLVSGYGRLRAACFLLMHVDEADGARRFLRWLAPLVGTGATVLDKSAINIAFGWEGLRELGLPGEAVNGFSEAFISGMTDPARSRFLGDVGEREPAGWLWGGPDTPRIDLALLVYARDAAVLHQQLKAVLAKASGVTEVFRLMAEDLPPKTDSNGFREPFGFRDGISQPVVEGLPQGRRGGDVIRAGEFVLGYPNEYGLLTERPVMAASLDPDGALPRAAAVPATADFGRNGTYLVVRDLAQDVDGFWRYLEEQTRDADSGPDGDRATALGAAMVGRWPSGAPLVLTRDRDDPALSTRNDFRYHAVDPEGLACPLGAHIRRANPRDSLEPSPGSDRSLAVSRRHRILRRSRAYPSASPSGPDRGGLYFMCLIGNLSRQFEFIQHTWLNNPNFNGLHDDADPLVGTRDERGATFTRPRRPIRERLIGMPDFVGVRGGGYFFLPGIRALTYLAQLDGLHPARDRGSRGLR